MAEYPTPPFLRRKPRKKNADDDNNDVSDTRVRPAPRTPDPCAGIPSHAHPHRDVDEYQKVAQKERQRRLEQYRTKEPEPGFKSFYWVPPDSFRPYEVIPGKTGQTSPVLGAVFEVLLSHDHQNSARRFIYPLHDIDDSRNGIACGLITKVDDHDH